MSSSDVMDERSNLVHGELGRRGNPLLLPQTDSQQQEELPFATFPNASNGNRVNEEQRALLQTINLFEISLVGVLAVMSTVTFILGLYRGLSSKHLAGTYFIMGLTHAFIVLLESLLIVFARNGQLEASNARFFYAIAILTLVHSLFTNIVMFSD